MGWLYRWLSGGRGFKITLINKEFSIPDASRDKCVMCGVKREFHDTSDHKFVERKEDV